jgi:hypothetical protein
MIRRGAAARESRPEKLFYPERPAATLLLQDATHRMVATVREPNQLQVFIDALVDLVRDNHERPVSETTWQQILDLDARIGQRCLELGITIPSLKDDNGLRVCSSAALHEQHDCFF